MSYFPDGQRMISGSNDKTARQWDLKAGKEIEEAQSDREWRVLAVAVSRNGLWVATGGGDGGCGELKVCEVETGIVKTLKEHSSTISCIDISADNTQLASGSFDKTARIWNLETGKLMAGPFKSIGHMGAVRFSPDSRKLAVKFNLDTSLEIWDIQSQKLDVRIGKPGYSFAVSLSPIFWTNKNKTVIAAFKFTTDSQSIKLPDVDDASSGPKMIHEFDASTLATVGAPFEGHKGVIRLALSFDNALLVSASKDTIKLWAFESRQLLASYHIKNIQPLVLSPDSRKIAYAVNTEDDYKICICDTPPDVLALACNIARKKSNLNHLLHSHATRPVGQRKPPIYATPTVQRPPPTKDPQKPAFRRLGKLLRFFNANTVPVSHIQPRDPLDVPATLPLPFALSAQPATRFDRVSLRFEIGSPPPPFNGVVQSLRQHLSFLVPTHSHGPPVVEVAPGRKFTRLAVVNLPDYKKVDDTRHPSSQQATVPQENDTADVDSLPDVHWCKAFLCYCSCWSHGRLRMPPRWRLEHIDIPRQDGAANSNSGGSQSHS
ncbi:hypothetical protein CY34DRAFT_803777 [Suillus luteus UH-Slu-Lm8-n1]|uniref:WD40 repeat-like protein n=1 Tax=Suillus luteus UH-Slu-Lm8-n1 TaxID=930992 RepID=A0A0D0B0J6_9AGAM|nr:hypothetical protein CY34DRAFT_803777 [Suillus luteus UH-Slu-Lm8-n1]